jgi:hypothetical protein
MFQFNDLLLGRIPFDTELLYWTIVMVDNLIVGSNFRPFSLFIYLNFLGSDT